MLLYSYFSFHNTWWQLSNCYSNLPIPYQIHLSKWITLSISIKGQLYYSSGCDPDFFFRLGSILLVKIQEYVNLSEMYERILATLDSNYKTNLNLEHRYWIFILTFYHFHKSKNHLIYLLWYCWVLPNICKTFLAMNYLGAFKPNFSIRRTLSFLAS